MCKKRKVQGAQATRSLTKLRSMQKVQSVKVEKESHTLIEAGVQKKKSGRCIGNKEFFWTEVDAKSGKCKGSEGDVYPNRGPCRKRKMQGAQAMTSLPQTEPDAKGSKSEGKNQGKVDNVSKRAVEAYITKVATIIFYYSLRKYTLILGDDAT